MTIKKTVLADRDDYRSVEQEEQYFFTRTTLLNIGLPIEDILPEKYEVFDIAKKINFRGFLDRFNIMVLDDRDGGIKIYHENSLMAEWKKPTFVLREDLSQINPKKRLYIEIRIEYASVFEGEDE